MKFAAVILAGGESRRMGRDKAWLQADGRSLISRALSVVRDTGIEELFISGRPGTDYSALQCPVLFDLEIDCGPLSGIERALEEASAPLILVLAVDMPHMTAGFLRKLLAHCQPLTGVIPKLRGEYEPLAAVYPKRCQFIARDFLRKGQRAVRDFANACLREHAVRVLPVANADAHCFDNWNTPSDVGTPKTVNGTRS